MIRIAILDDYQNVSLELADWSPLAGRAEITVFNDHLSKFDEIVEDKGVMILVDPKAVMFILGTEMDYVEEKLQSGFVFRNPNEKGRCGCGESFHV